MANGTILAFNLNEMMMNGLRAICESMDLKTIEVPESCFGMTLGAIVEGTGTSPRASKGASFEGPMLVMALPDEQTFNLFLQALRFSGLPKIDLKAVLTPYNVSWTAVRLHDELKREHEKMHPQM